MGVCILRSVVRAESDKTTEVLQGSYTFSVAFILFRSKYTVCVRAFAWLSGHEHRITVLCPLTEVQSEFKQL